MGRAPELLIGALTAAGACSLAACVGGRAPLGPAPAQVLASVETQAVNSGEDAADDPAIWLHPSDLAASRILGTDKQRGLEVYDLAGRRVQELAVGRLNNVDVRQGVRLGVSAPRDIAAATNRTSQSIDLFVIEADGVVSLAGGFPAGFAEPYGLCLYADPAGGGLDVIATDKTGRLRQWRLSGLDAVPALVREGDVGSVVEGCAVDDAAGALFFAQESVGLFALPVDPAVEFGARRLIEAVRPAGRIAPDAEGVAIYAVHGGGGYLVVSSQGDDRYHVFDRAAPHGFRGAFVIAAGPQIDATQETDGIALSAPTLPGFPGGLFVAQDGDNRDADNRPETQNFKLVPWASIAAALELE